MSGKIRRFATRTVKDVELTFEAEAGRETENFDIVYRSYSQRWLDDLMAFEGKTVGDAIPFSADLSLKVVSITDKQNQPLTNDAGEPALKEVKGPVDSEEFKEAVAHNRSFFDSLDIANARALDMAIDADINPPTPSPTPGDSGSNPATAAAE
jgi:hypothetical protein